MAFLHAPCAPACPQGPLVLDQLVHVVLGAVLTGGDLENEGNAEQGFLGIPVRNNLQDGEILQDTVHHVLLREVLEFVDEVDHVFAEGRAVDAIGIVSIFVACILCLYFLYHLLSKGTHFGGTGNDHVFWALILAGNAIERSGFIFDIGIQISPEFDKEEGISWPPFKELLQAPFFLRELVIDLPDIHCLEVGVIVAGA